MPATTVAVRNIAVLYVEAPVQTLPSLQNFAEATKTAVVPVIVRVIAEAGVITHAGVIAPLCVNFSSLESSNSFSAQGSESSRRGAMTPILVPPSSVRLHAVACGFRIKIVPRSVFLAVCNRGSPLFAAGAHHTYLVHKKK